MGMKTSFPLKDEYRFRTGYQGKYLDPEEGRK
jgi:hypothetical protein